MAAEDEPPLVPSAVVAPLSIEGLMLVVDPAAIEVLWPFEVGFDPVLPPAALWPVPPIVATWSPRTVFDGSPLSASHASSV